MVTSPVVTSREMPVPAVKDETPAPPPAGATLCHVVPLLVRTFPESEGATKVGDEVPLPRITLSAVSVASPVPPEDTASVAESPAAVPVLFWFKTGKVQLVSVPLEGVPSAPPGRTKSVPAVAAESFVPSAFTMPVMVADSVICGVVVPLATLPAKPLALTTETP